MHSSNLHGQFFLYIATVMKVKAPCKSLNGELVTWMWQCVRVAVLDIRSGILRTQVKEPHPPPQCGAWDAKGRLTSNYPEALMDKTRAWNIKGSPFLNLEVAMLPPHYRPAGGRTGWCRVQLGSTNKAPRLAPSPTPATFSCPPSRGPPAIAI